MSVASTVTLVNDAEEPASKRQKTELDSKAATAKEEAFAYGTDVVFLKAFGKTVAHVPASKFDRVWLLSASSAWRNDSTLLNGGTPDENVHIRSFYFNACPNVVKFVAHWTHERDVASAINATREDEDMINFFLSIYRLVIENYQLTHQLHDALIDTIIDWLRTDMLILADPYQTFLEVYEAYRDMFDGLPTSPGKLGSLFSVLALYYDRTNEGWCPDYGHYDETLRTEALSYFRTAWLTRDWSKMPRNPLEADFRDPCLYHCHGPGGCHLATKK